MAGTTSDKLALLRQIKEAFRAAITGKGQTISDDDPFSSWPAKVEAIETGVDTSDATATASDMAKGVTAYVNGEKVIGNLDTYKSGNTIYLTAEDRDVISSDLYTQCRSSSDLLLRSGVNIFINDPITNFGDATAADVASGKTFTSSAGLKVTGNVTTTSTGFKFSTPTLTKNVTNLDIKQRFSSDYLFRNGSYVTLATSLSNFGDATAADVAAGKTFTSSAGLKVTGTNEVIPNCSVTMINQSGRALQAFVIDNNGATLAYHFNASGSTRYVTTKHPFFIAGLDPDNNSSTHELSISMSGLQDLGTSTNNTFEYIKVYGFKPTDTTATITIS